MLQFFAGLIIIVPFIALLVYLLHIIDEMMDGQNKN